jgi:hypothetical protein
MPARVASIGERWARARSPKIMTKDHKEPQVLYTITVKDDGSFHVETAVGTKFVAHTLVVANRMALSHVADFKQNKRTTWFERNPPSEPPHESEKAPPAK